MKEPRVYYVRSDVRGGRHKEVFTSDAPGLQEIPEHWEIFNAPRPLYGQLTWTGDNIHGIFYAAIDPDDEFSEGYRRQNIKNNGYLLVYITDQEAEERARAWYLKKFGDRYRDKVHDPANRHFLINRFFEVMNDSDSDEEM